MKNDSLYPFVIPILFLCFWQIGSTFQVVSPLFLPAPLSVIESFIFGFASGAFLVDLGYTLSRVLISFLLAASIGIPLGLIMGYSKKVYRIGEFPLEFSRSIPPSALFPLFLLLFGIGEPTKIAVAVWGAGLVILVHSYYGVRLGKDLRLRVAKTLKLRGVALFTKAILPEALPQIFSGLRIAISLCLMLIVVTEMFIGTTNGLGGRIMDAQLVYRSADMYAAIILTGTLGYFLNKALLALEKRLIHWNGR